MKLALSLSSIIIATLLAPQVSFSDTSWSYSRQLKTSQAGKSWKDYYSSRRYNHSRRQNNSPAPTPSPAPAPIPVKTDNTSLEQAMVNLINQARSRSRQCGSQTYKAAPPISWNQQLKAAAQSHSTDMATHNFFSHTGSDGLSVGSRVKAQDYRWTRVGENIAAGTTTADATITLWLNSAGHCANIMNPAFTEIGAAKAENATADYRVYWTLVLATQ